MKERQNKIDRRDFLKTAGAAGLGSVLTSVGARAGPNEPNTPEKPKKPKLPMRKLGKTGVKVPCLALGVMFNAVEKQIVLRKAFQLGVTYWDTAYGYVGGNSELGIGKFLSKNPQVRKDLFIATKASGAGSVKDVEKRLQTSLKRMNTKYIDLYYGVHAMSKPDRLTDELRNWAKDAKKRGLIRFFGFTTHTNMPQCLTAASKLDWIDAIMTRYNFRYLQDPQMQAALDACHKAGIGLIAMKVQSHKVKAEEDKKLASHFVKKGFTEGQAKIKVILQDKRFASACVGGHNITHLTLNVAAVQDKTKLTQADMAVFNEYARQTCSGYCAGCADICDAVLPQAPYTSDIMRYLMYYNSYGEQDSARELFAKIPASVRNRLPNIDYSVAETRCPQHLPIGKLVCEAVSKLA